jgi:hypothetical protein
MARPRFVYTVITPGQLPAVWDRKIQQVVHSYRNGQEKLARAMVEKLNGNQ